jgi:transposase-like protein
MDSKDIDVSTFWCWNKECPDYGKKNHGNIVPKEQYGKDEIWLMRCKTCGHTFSENKGTVFYQMKTPRREILQTLALFPEKGSIRGMARASGHDKNVIMHWLDVAGEHCREVNDYFLHDLELDQVQVDEIWSYIKKRQESKTR